METKSITADEIVGELKRLWYWPGAGLSRYTVTDSAVIGTGGGCLAVEANLDDGRYIWMTDGDAGVEFDTTVIAALFDADHEQLAWAQVQSETLDARDIRAVTQLVLEKANGA